MGNRWQPDNASGNCSKCRCQFGVIHRKHHCRYCGNIFCKKCSEGAKTFEAGGKEPLRVCTICFRLTSVPQYLQGAGKSVFPKGILVEIFSYLPPSELLSITGVSMQWNYVASHPVLWNFVVRTIFPNMMTTSLSGSLSSQLDKYGVGCWSALVMPPSKDDGCVYKQQPPTPPANEHCTLSQRSLNGVIALTLPHYSSCCSSVTRRSDTSLGSLSFTVSLSDIRNWKYFMLEKILEVAHLDLEYPINSSLFSRYTIITKVLKSFEMRLVRGLWIPNAT
eukprot:TRINITY_DN2837_c3_g3_i1.p1 TRINITY_DN2837_c3_g3~~TRINITY_DN2837_c3_g3_i1.p1  ORF type:complete len:278 (+),score=10.44 TRINITY_DN2837_c3_g3_i1:41-874(+)